MPRKWKRNSRRSSTAHRALMHKRRDGSQSVRWNRLSVFIFRVPQERTQQCTVEETVGVPIPRIQGPIDGMAKMISSGGVFSQTPEQSDEVINTIPREELSDHIEEQIAVPETTDETAEMIQSAPQERVQHTVKETIEVPVSHEAHPTGAQIVALPVSQIQERPVEIAKGIDRERVEQHTSVDVRVIMQVRVPAINVLQETVEVPQAHIPDSTRAYSCSPLRARQTSAWTCKGALLPIQSHKKLLKCRRCIPCTRCSKH